MSILSAVIGRYATTDQTIEADISLLRKSPLLDPVWYRESYIDLRETPIDVARHYLLYGAKEGRRPGPLFDPELYFARNPELRKADVNPLLHYIKSGATGPFVEEKRFDSILVSVIIPIYNRTWELREAIESILSQDYQNLELLLILDGSPRETREVVDQYRSDGRVRIFSFPTPSGNAVRPRNKGILEAKGRYVAFLDSDDVALPHRLSLSIRELESGGADVVYGAWIVALDGSRDIEGIHDGQLIKSPPCDFEMLRDLCVPSQSTVMVRKSALDAYGYLKSVMQYREDHELWARLALNGCKFSSIDQPLTRIRLHDGNNERAFKGNDRHWARLMKREYHVCGPRPKKICFVLPGVGISGGVAVVFKHASMLLAFGHDVMVLSMYPNEVEWYHGLTVPVYYIDSIDDYVLEGIDLLFATGWQTVDLVEKIASKRKLYFVQSDERRFVDDTETKSKISDGYRKDFEYLTEAHWIARLLKDEFGRNATYVPNGLDQSMFVDETALEPRGPRKRILLEGPICIPFKGMADAYAAVENLDCEIWVVSSAGLPPEDWKVDRFFTQVPFGEMAKIYSSCDIFLKMSRIEGFFGPPLEAMSCGCAVVVGKVTGWEEYIAHDINALVVEQGDVAGARAAVASLIDDEDLRIRLIKEGRDTAREWSWNVSFERMKELVGPV